MFLCTKNCVTSLPFAVYLYSPPKIFSHVIHINEHCAQIGQNTEWQVLTKISTTHVFQTEPE